jgi:hypothetical protein
MKTKICILITVVFSFFEITFAQTAASTGDLVALPTTVITSAVDTDFPAPLSYSANSSVPQLGVNNTGTDICQIYTSTTPAPPPLFCQAMVWDKVTNASATSLTSKVFLSWKFETSISSSLQGSFPFPFQGSSFGGFDPDVAIFSDASGTFIQVVFENLSTGNIDGFTFKWDGATFNQVITPFFKTTFRNDGTKKAKNPNIAVPKSGKGIAVVWHEEGQGPSVQLNISYSTTPPINFTNTVAITQSKVYIYCEEKTPNILLGTFASILGKEVILTNTATNHLFDRNFNPDVSFSEDRVYPTNPNRIKIGISVAFVSTWFNPASFQIETGNLSVVQGDTDDFNLSTNTTNYTTTRNFISDYVGKPRIAARLSNGIDNLSKDFSVVMGNSITSLASCPGGSNTTVSKLHNWYFQTGGTLCPPLGHNLLTGTTYDLKVSI